MPQVCEFPQLAMGLSMFARSFLTTGCGLEESLTQLGIRQIRNTPLSIWQLQLIISFDWLPESSYPCDQAAQPEAFARILHFPQL